MPAWASVEDVSFDVLRCIRVREKWKSRLLSCVNDEDLGLSRDVATVEDLVLLYRSATIEVAERIVEWRALMPNPFVPFTCGEAENYLLYLVSDLETPVASPSADDIARRWIDIFCIKQVRRNPLLLPENLDEMVVAGTPTTKEQLVGSVLLQEESLYGRAPRNALSWAYTPAPLPDTTKIPPPSKSNLRRKVLEDQERNIRFSTNFLKVEKAALARDKEVLVHLSHLRSDVDKERGWIQAHMAPASSHSEYCGRSRVVALKRCDDYTREISKSMALVEASMAERTKSIARLSLVRRNSKGVISQMASQRKLSILEEENKRNEVKLRELTKMRNQSFAASRRKNQLKDDPPAQVKKSPTVKKSLNQAKANQEIPCPADSGEQIHQQDAALEIQSMTKEDHDILLPQGDGPPGPILKTRHQIRYFERLLVPTCIVRLKLGECDCKIAIISKKAQGYTPAGLVFLVVGYESPSILSLRLSDGEYDAWGYGRSQAGYEHFCRWLCVVYMKRKRRFNLVWCGSSCPRPLRSDDDTLICIHKEGIKLPHPREFVLAAIFHRRATSTLASIVANMANNIVTEYSTTLDHSIAHMLQIISASDHLDIHLKLDVVAPTTTNETAVNTEGLAACSVLFSGPVSLTDGASVQVKVYEYGNVYIVQTTAFDATTRREFLLKDDINPLKISLAARDLTPLFANGRAYDAKRDFAMNLPWLRQCICNHARSFCVARFGLRRGGRYYLVSVLVIQDKVEYRSGLQFRAIQIGASSLSGEVAVSLSKVLRCPNRISANLGLSPGLEITTSDDHDVSTPPDPHDLGVVMHCRACLDRIRNVLANGVAPYICFHNSLSVKVCFSVYCAAESVAKLKAHLEQNSSNANTVDEADFGLTVASVQDYLERSNWHGLAVFVVPAQLDSFAKKKEMVDCDLLLQGHDLDRQQRELLGGEAIDAPNFEHYLIAEALVMEATMLCYKFSASLALKKPSSVTGASSWKFACQLMACPHAFHSSFQSPVKWMSLPDELATVLLQFQSHPEWKLTEHMKDPFKALYRWLDAGMMLLQTIRRRKGLLRHHASAGDVWTVFPS